ncbi:hypothetical protein ACFL2E_09590, partial [Thermodesulfobacteriota bacterium]
YVLLNSDTIVRPGAFGALRNNDCDLHVHGSPSNLSQIPLIKFYLILINFHEKFMYLSVLNIENKKFVSRLMKEKISLCFVFQLFSKNGM